jgi:hypothetical protein
MIAKTITYSSLTLKKTFFLISFLSLIAVNSFSQTITINKKNKSLKEIINSIEEQTSYRVLFNAKKVNSAAVISLEAINLS